MKAPTINGGIVVLLLTLLHFPDAARDRFPRSRVRGTCRRVVRHVLRRRRVVVVGALPVPSPSP